MTKVLEDKIVSLETQLKDVTTTLFKYERRLKDQKLFCDCAAKFFLHKFGFDIWLQLDMLKSALEEASSDSDAESLFPKRISKLILSSRKRHHHEKTTNHGEKRARLDVRGARVGEATSSGMLAASPGIVTPTEVQILRQNQKNSGPVSNDTAGGPSSAHSPSDVIDVDSSDENNVTGVNQVEHSPGSPGIPSVNPQVLVKCESEFYEESVDADMNCDDGPDEILGGIPFDGFGDTGNYRASSRHHSLRFAGTDVSGNIILQWTKKGRPMVFMNGYTYYFKEYSKTLNEMTWRCNQYNKKAARCEAVLKTIDNVPKNDPSADHTH